MVYEVNSGVYSSRAIFCTVSTEHLLSMSPRLFFFFFFFFVIVLFYFYLFFALVLIFCFHASVLVLIRTNAMKQGMIVHNCVS